MDHLEYLVGYGLVGDFGRFRADRPLACRRGDRVVIRSHRGLEVGQVLRPATGGHAHFLPNTTVGKLLRCFTATDATQLSQSPGRVAAVLEQAVKLARAMDLPLELLDAEMLLDGEHAVLHFLRWADCDVRPFVSSLSKTLGLHILLQDLSQPQGDRVEEETEQHSHEGCGREGCGSSAGGCGNCSTGGGCSTCGAGSPRDLPAYFAELRQKMEQQRTPLL